jgi:hypothetical protein
MDAPKPRNKCFTGFLKSGKRDIQPYKGTGRFIIRQKTGAAYVNRYVKTITVF